MRGKMKKIHIPTNLISDQVGLPYFFIYVFILFTFDLYILFHFYFSSKLNKICLIFLETKCQSMYSIENEEM